MRSPPASIAGRPSQRLATTSPATCAGRRTASSTCGGTALIRVPRRRFFRNDSVFFQLRRIRHAGDPVAEDVRGDLGAYAMLELADEPERPQYGHPLGDGAVHHEFACMDLGTEVLPNLQEEVDRQV